MESTAARRAVHTLGGVAASEVGYGRTSFGEFAGVGPWDVLDCECPSRRMKPASLAVVHHAVSAEHVHGDRVRWQARVLVPYIKRELATWTWVCGDEATRAAAFYVQIPMDRADTALAVVELYLKVAEWRLTPPPPAHAMKERSALASLFEKGPGLRADAWRHALVVTDARERDALAAYHAATDDDGGGGGAEISFYVEREIAATAVTGRRLARIAARLLSRAGVGATRPALPPLVVFHQDNVGASVKRRLNSVLCEASCSRGTDAQCVLVTARLPSPEVRASADVVALLPSVALLPTSSAYHYRSPDVDAKASRATEQMMREPQRPLLHLASKVGVTLTLRQHHAWGVPSALPSPSALAGVHPLLLPPRTSSSSSSISPDVSAPSCPARPGRCGGPSGATVSESSGSPHPDTAADVGPCERGRARKTAESAPMSSDYTELQAVLGEYVSPPVLRALIAGYCETAPRLWVADWLTRGEILLTVTTAASVFRRIMFRAWQREGRYAIKEVRRREQLAQIAREAGLLAEPGDSVDVYVGSDVFNCYCPAHIIILDSRTICPVCWGEAKPGQLLR